MFTELIESMDAAHARAGEIKLPLLVVHGSADSITPADASRRFADALGSEQKEFVALEGQYHEVLNEPEKEETIQRVIDWFVKHGA